MPDTKSVTPKNSSLTPSSVIVTMLFTCSTLRSVHWRFLLAECYSELETLEGEMLAKRRERLVADESMQITVSDQNCGCVAQTSSASVLRNATGFSNADLDTFRLLIDYAHENVVQNHTLR